MNKNPAYRYATVPVELPLAREPVAFVVRMQSKDEAVQKVARSVDADALVDLEHTRTFDTKHQAKRYASKHGWSIRELPYSSLKNKLLR